MSSQPDTSQQINLRSLFLDGRGVTARRRVPLSEVSLRKRWVRMDPDALSPFQLAANCGETADVEFGYLFAETFVRSKAGTPCPKTGTQIACFSL